jgi:hypothetical protein
MIKRRLLVGLWPLGVLASEGTRVGGLLVSPVGASALAGIEFDLPLSEL